MRMNSVCKGVVVAALCMLPGALLASSEANHPAVNKGGSSNQTASLFQQIRSDALSVNNNVDQLREHLRDGYLYDWRIDGDLLNNICDNVNEMNKLVFQLRAEEGRAPHWQHKFIEKIASTGVNLADTTQEAIGTFSENQDRLYATDLFELANDMYEQAGLVAKEAGNIQKYAEARHEVQELKQTLGLRSAS